MRRVWWNSGFFFFFFFFKEHTFSFHSLPSCSAHIAFFNWWVSKAHIQWFFSLWLLRGYVTRHSLSSSACVQGTPQLCSLDTLSLCFSSHWDREEWSCLLCATGSSTFTRGCWIDVAKIPVCKSLYDISHKLRGQTLPAQWLQGRSG